MLQSKTVRKYDKYKDSGIEWIGKIPQEWTARKLFGLLKSIGSGTTPKGNDNYYDGDIPWLNTGDLTDSYINIIGKTVTDIAMTECSALKLFDKDSVVIAMYGATIGKLGILTFPTTTNQACCVMSCGNKLNNKYLFYVLYSARDYILTLSYGAGQPNISQETMKAFKLCCPNIDEQQMIAEYLDKKCGEIDRVIETEKAVIEKLKEYKQSIITEAVTKGLDKSAPLKDSGIEWIGKIPQHWKIRRIKNSSVIISKGTTPTTMGYEIIDNGNIRFIKAENIQNNVLVNEPYSSIDEQTNDALKRSQLEINDILFVIAGATIGKVAIINEDFLPANTNQAVSFIRLKQSENHKFIWYFLQSYYVKEKLNILAVQSAQPNLSMEDLGNFYFAYPLAKEQQQIAEYLDNKCFEIDKAIADKEQVIEKFTEYKKSLIYECVTGKRKVCA